MCTEYNQSIKMFTHTKSLKLTFNHRSRTKLESSVFYFIALIKLYYKDYTVKTTYLAISEHNCETIKLCNYSTS